MKNGDGYRMKLPNGITGFCKSEVDLPPQVDEKQFKQICFNIVLRNGGKVKKFNSSGYITNFYSTQIELFDKQFFILLNEHYPFLAFASNVEYCDIKFLDMPILFEQFSTYYKVIKTEKLNESVILRPGSKNGILQNEHELNSAELKQIAYWKPETIGNIIFNYWD